MVTYGMLRDLFSQYGWTPFGELMECNCHYELELVKGIVYFKETGEQATLEDVMFYYSLYSPAHAGFFCTDSQYIN
jgi:hypothetical protein